MEIGRAFDFTGKVAAITGGGGVLCGTMARGLAECGAAVAVLDLNQSAAEQVAAGIREGGRRAMAIQTNVLDRESLAQSAEAVAAAWGRVDILINGAGGAKKEATTGPTLAFWDLPEDAVRWVFDLNFMGTFMACQVFGRRMVKQGSGRILNISSMGSFRPLTRSVAYSAAKAAITNFTSWLAVHIAQEYSTNIHVNAIAPGFFLTEQNRFLLIDEATGELTERGGRIIAHTPLGRFGNPEDLLAPALLLLSDAAGFLHGTTLAVDGGFEAYGGV
jgi:NAD(P)-dependent dehydrogenase (short-subunit alcohol dehydrogenase family)